MSAEAAINHVNERTVVDDAEVDSYGLTGRGCLGGFLNE